MSLYKPLLRAMLVCFAMTTADAFADNQMEAVKDGMHQNMSDEKAKVMDKAADKSKDMKMAMEKSLKPDKVLIASAESAAPKSVGKNATVVVMNPDGSMRTLREGTNGFTCMPDMENTPGPDPMCFDKNSAGWVQAWLAHKIPPKGKVGFMYMLQGGTDTSNTDPYLDKPEGGKWLKTGPHVMVMGADDSFYDQYPKSPNPDTKQPYVMWPGTPYQHLMAPVE